MRHFSLGGRCGCGMCSGSPTHHRVYGNVCHSLKHVELHKALRVVQQLDEAVDAPGRHYGLLPGVSCCDCHQRPSSSRPHLDATCHTGTVSLKVRRGLGGAIPSKLRAPKGCSVAGRLGPQWPSSEGGTRDEGTIPWGASLGRDRPSPSPRSKGSSVLSLTPSEPGPHARAQWRVWRTWDAVGPSHLHGTGPQERNAGLHSTCLESLLQSRFILAETMFCHGQQAAGVEMQHAMGPSQP